MICLMLKPGQNFFVYCIQSKVISSIEKEFLKEKEELMIEKQTKRRLFNCSCYGD